MRRTPATISSTSGRSSCSCAAAASSRNRSFWSRPAQALVSEGIAETGADLLLDDAARDEVQALLQAHGIGYDAEAAHELASAFETLRSAGLDAALMIHEEGRPDRGGAGARRALGPANARAGGARITFVTDPTWRAYAITYSAGRDLCRGYVGGDPARFRRLLTEQIRVRDLLAARA